jgi:hypothetical protein
MYGVTVTAVETLELTVAEEVTASEVRVEVQEIVEHRGEQCVLCEVRPEAYNTACYKQMAALK